MTPGYWCECTTQHSIDTTTFTASFTANSPHQAVRWIRIALRTISPALDPAAAEHAWQWLLHDHTRATTDLHQGQAIALTIQHHATALTWTARPVLFLPLAHRHSRQLPPCAERFHKPEPHRPTE
jgi:hypothetical protein